MDVVQEEGLKEQLVEASEILQIIESYFSKDLSQSDAFALRGLKVLLKESRTRVERVATQLGEGGSGVSQSSSAENQARDRENPVEGNLGIGKISASRQNTPGIASSGNGARISGPIRTGNMTSSILTSDALASGAVGDARRVEGRTLASRIKRLPEGEFRTVELDLESETDELVAEEY